MQDINTPQILSKNCYLLSNPFSRFRGLVAYEPLNHRRGAGGTHPRTGSDREFISYDF